MFTKQDVESIKHDLNGKTNALIMAIKNLKKVVDDPQGQKLVQSSLASLNELEQKHLELISKLIGGQNDE